jgi:hypothetical protein
MVSQKLSFLKKLSFFHGVVSQKLSFFKKLSFFHGVVSQKLSFFKKLSFLIHHFLAGAFPKYHR